MNTKSESSSPHQPPGPTPGRWYEGISSYQWLVLLIASLGWVFDVFEGQVFVASMNDAMPQLLGEQLTEDLKNEWNNYSLTSFLLGGAFGGILFGILSDRIGRSRTMIITILFYSVFTGVTAIAGAPWQMVVLRFFVAMGVGGEWAVASAMVAEVMPQRSRPVMSSIFHASSVFGTLMAVTVGYFVLAPRIMGENTWRLGFLIGVIPAMLTLIIRWKMREPERWQQAKQREAKDVTQTTGLLSDLFSRANLRHTVVGTALATIGLTTFWGCHIYGKNALKTKAESGALVAAGLADINWATASQEEKAKRTKVLNENAENVKEQEMIGMFLTMVLGGGLGLVLFGTISNALGRKGAFLFYHSGSLIVAVTLFSVLIPGDYPKTLLIVFLPVFGFLTLGMHAGYAVYFPELFPTRIRSTGAGFCFNAARLGSACAMLIAGILQWSPNQSALYLSPLFAVGIIVTLLAKETRGEELPE